jgi:tetratricopeptide (TPR) repeat protein/predicted Ser/Thr protein kinase
MPQEPPNVSSPRDAPETAAPNSPQIVASTQYPPIQTVDYVAGTPAAGEPASVPDMLVVPGYELLRTLGRGGMGVVYLARHTGLDRLVALKMILNRHVDSDLRGRFRTEAEAVARVKHPNIIQIYDIGEVDGCPYLSLEYVEGGSLAQQLNGTPQPPEKAAELVSVLAHAVHAAHLGGVIHRDLKPGNILLTSSGQPKVADFGLAKKLEGPSNQTVSGSILGTPSYMAPEQTVGRSSDIGARADVYALGAILYEALTGRPPFRGATVLDTLAQVRTQEPVPPSSLQPKVPRDLETICLKCLQKEPLRRYDSAEALGEDLERFLRHEPIRARTVSAWERLVRWRRRNPAVAALLAILAVGLVVSVWLAILAQNRADRIAAINVELTNTTKESEDRGELALKTLEAVIQDIQTELTNLPNAQKLRRRLLERAMDGIQRLDDKLRTQARANRSTAQAFLSMAEVFRQVGSDSGSRGPAMANQLYERAIAIFEKLHEESPDDVETKGQLAEAYLLYGINLARTDDTGWEATVASTAEQKKRPLLQRSLAVHRQAAELRRELLASRPDDLGATYQLARALTEWAYDEVRAGDVERARALLEEAYRLLKRLLAVRPDHVATRMLLAKCSSRLGDWYHDMKEDYVHCEPYFKESLEVMKRLAEEQPNDADIQMDYADSWSKIADMHVGRKELQAALAASQQELAITQKLEKAYPDNVQMTMDTSVSYDHNYRDNFALGNYEVARDMVRKAFDMRLPLIDADPDNRRNCSLLGRTTKRLGGVYDRLGQTAEAVKAYEAGLSRLTAYRQRSQDHSVDKDIADIQSALEKCRKRPAGK